MVRDLDQVIEPIIAELGRAGWAYVPPELDTGASWRRYASRQRRFRPRLARWRA